ncbi:MAG: hypothetical protein Q7O66_01105 [Dehalococcoidia bacterium]|nr:hypothetical protein [Dehalococcoidia bacterium]
MTILSEDEISGLVPFERFVHLGKWDGLLISGPIVQADLIDTIDAMRLALEAWMKWAYTDLPATGAFDHAIALTEAAGVEGTE